MLVRTRDGLVDWKKPADIDAGPASKHGGVDCWKSWACLPRLRTEWTDIAVLDLPASRLLHAVDGRDHPNLRIEVPGGPGLAVHSPTASRSTTTLATCSVSTPPKAMSAPSVAASTARWASRFTVKSRTWLLASSSCSPASAVAAVAYDRLDRHSCEIKAASTPLAHLLVALIGKGARNKRVPAQILNGPLGVRQGFLEGILDGDGKNPSRETNPTGRRDLKTASRSLAWGVRTLLADIGHWASISTGESPSVFPWGTSPGPIAGTSSRTSQTVGIRGPWKMNSSSIGRSCPSIRCCSTPRSSTSRSKRTTPTSQTSSSTTARPTWPPAPGSRSSAATSPSPTAT